MTNTHVLVADGWLGQAKYHARKVPTSNGRVEGKIGTLVDQMLPPCVAVK